LFPLLVHKFEVQGSRFKVQGSTVRGCVLCFNIER
jgi:hypothetical protein